ADFWCGWSVLSPGPGFSIGQARVTAGPFEAVSGQKYGLATESPTGERVTPPLPTRESRPSPLLSMAPPGPSGARGAGGGRGAGGRKAADRRAAGKRHRRGRMGSPPEARPVVAARSRPYTDGPA